MTMKVNEMLKRDAPFLIRKSGVTAAEFEQISEDEDIKVELLDGVLFLHSSASTPHEDIFAFLLFLMRGYTERRQLGKAFGSRVRMELSADRKPEPDLLFVKTEHLGQLLKKQLEGPADLVVEILSEFTRAYDLGDKRLMYREANIPEIWFIDADNQVVRVDRKREAGYKEEVIHEGRVVSEVMEGFWLEASWLWQVELPEPLECLLAILGTL